MIGATNRGRRQNEAKSAAAGTSGAWAGIGARCWDLFGLIQDLYAATRATTRFLAQRGHSEALQGNARSLAVAE